MKVCAVFCNQAAEQQSKTEQRCGKFPQRCSVLASSQCLRLRLFPDGFHRLFFVGGR
jgi:hypothetical protein